MDFIMGNSGDKKASEEQLLELLEQACSKDLGYEAIQESFEKIHLEDSILTITFHGTVVDGVITTPMMEAVIALQKQVYQIYADVYYNGNARSLTDDERRALELNVKVENGSTIVQILLNVLIAKLVDNLTESSSMEDNTKLIIIIAVLILYNGGAELVKWFLNKRAKKKQEGTSEELKEIEILRLENRDKEAQRKHELEIARLEKELKTTEMIIESTKTEAAKVDYVRETLAKKHIDTENTIEKTESVVKPLMVAAERSEGINIEGLSIRYDEAELMRKSVPSEKLQVQLNGSYMVRMVNAKEVGIFKVQILNTNDGSEIWATVQEDDKSGIRDVLKDAEWDKKPVHLNINAYKKEGQILEAVIISAEWLE